MKRLQTLFYYFSLMALLFGLSSCDQSESIGSSELDSDTNPVLLVSIDGFTNQYLERNDTPNFDRFLSQGVKAEYLTSVFPTKTFPTHWTIATGLYAENHGIIANSFYDYELEARFSYGPVGTPNDERWWGGEPIWITAEKEGKTATTFFWPGSEASINGLRPTKWVDYDGSVPGRDRIDQVMSWLDPTGDVKADFGTLYFSFVDSRGHSFGPESSEVDETVQETDVLLGYLLDKKEETGLNDKLNVILVSDHGMASTSSERVIFLEEIIDLNSVDMVTYTPVAMIKPDEGKTTEVYDALKSNEENYRVYLKDELPERFHFSNHYRIPEIVMIADVGYTITSRQFFEERGIVAGTHGYDNLAPEMRSFFAANGPDFVSGVISPPFESVHIYELIANILDIQPAENDGSIDEVNFLLKNQ
jgi:predicted AlkP superfamily pyrophosphatase or phosphodiesterase